MYEERLDAYLDDLDSLANDWWPEGGFDRHGNALAFDEWNALRTAVGLPMADFDDYLTAIDIDLPAGCDYQTG